MNWSLKKDLDRIFSFGITLNNTPDFLNPTLIWFAELVCDRGSPFINNSVGRKLIILARPMLWFRRQRKFFPKSDERIWCGHLDAPTIATFTRYVRNQRSFKLL